MPIEPHQARLTRLPAAEQLELALARAGRAHDAVGLARDAAGEVAHAPGASAQGQVAVGQARVTQPGEAGDGGHLVGEGLLEGLVAPVAVPRAQHGARAGPEARGEHVQGTAFGDAVAHGLQRPRQGPEGGLEHHEGAALREAWGQGLEHGGALGDGLFGRGRFELVEHEAEDDEVEVAAGRIARDLAPHVGDPAPHAHGYEARFARTLGDPRHGLEGPAVLVDGHCLDRFGRPCEGGEAGCPEGEGAGSRAQVQDPPGVSLGQGARSGELAEGPADLRQVPWQEEADPGRQVVAPERPHPLPLARVDRAQVRHLPCEGCLLGVLGTQDGARRPVDGCEQTSGHIDHAAPRHVRTSRPDRRFEADGATRRPLDWPVADGPWYVEAPMERTPPEHPPALAPDTRSKGRDLWLALAALTALLMMADLYLIFAVAPIELQMGIVQKIFYFHVPSAYAMYVGFGTSAVASAVFLIKRSERWDALAVAAAEVGVVFCAIVLTTGPLWARKAWGVWWTWDPRLTTTLLAGMIFFAYLALRSFGGAGEAEKRFAAGLALVGVLDLPIIHYSVQRWRGQHPTVITGKGGGIAPSMVPALLTSFATFTALVVLLIWARARAERARQRLEALRLEAAERGLLEDE